jgi:Nif-specific regulatory protein
VRDSPGIFRAAAGGVVFLDEIGEMPLQMQAKLLRVLEQEEIIPIGDSFPVKVDVRIISATNKNLEEEIRLGNFREDLYWRLAAFPIRLPPLRERREDISLLASRFVAMAAGKTNKQISGIEMAAVELMNQFDWPGNIRQLRNEIERAVALSRNGDPLKAEYLLPLIKGAMGRPPLPAAKAAAAAESLIASPSTGVSATPPIPPGSSRPLREMRAEWEAETIRKALLEHNNNVSRTAQVLDISRPALQEKMKAFGLRIR